jgi:hypothetical protein
MARLFRQTLSAGHLSFCTNSLPELCASARNKTKNPALQPGSLFNGLVQRLIFRCISMFDGPQIPVVDHCPGQQYADAAGQRA